ncbi:hypothetical protein V6N13_047665 [Hibiscus sabdariffa]
MTRSLLLEHLGNTEVGPCFVLGLLVPLDRLQTCSFLRRHRIPLGEGQGGCVWCEAEEEGVIICCFHVVLLGTYGCGSLGGGGEFAFVAIVA